MTDPVEDAETILRDYQAWCYKRAGDMTTGAFVDDLAQEGLLAMWKALQTYDPDKGALPAWLTRNATWRMREVVTGAMRMAGSEIGKQSHGNGVYNYVKEQRQTSPVDTRPAVGEPEHQPLLGSAPAPLEDYATSAYHRGQIVEAINTLPPAQREYVYLRFWRDYRTPEMRDHYGYDPTSGLWNNPKRGAKNRLRLVLSDLAESEPDSSEPLAA